MDYRLTLDSDAFEFFQTLRPEKRRKILDKIRQLKAAPFSEGQWRTQEPTGRALEVSVVDDLSIYHWTDHLGKMVYVTRLEKLT